MWLLSIKYCFVLCSLSLARCSLARPKMTYFDQIFNHFHMLQQSQWATKYYPSQHLRIPRVAQDWMRLLGIKEGAALRFAHYPPLAARLHGKRWPVLISFWVIFACRGDYGEWYKTSVISALWTPWWHRVEWGSHVLWKVLHCASLTVYCSSLTCVTKNDLFWPVFGLFSYAVMIVMSGVKHQQSQYPRTLWVA